MRTFKSNHSFLSDGILAAGATSGDAPDTGAELLTTTEDHWEDTLGCEAGDGEASESADYQPAHGHQPAKSALLDPRSIRDSIVREIAILDQQALERALRFGDLRLAAVHQRSILEAAMLDCIVKRGIDLGLTRISGLWSLWALALKLLGADASERERKALESICTADELIKPFKQYSKRSVLTPDDLDAQLDVMKKVLRKLGFGELAQADSIRPQQPSAGSGEPARPALDSLVSEMV